MRNHQIDCRLEGSKSQNDIQRTINKYTTIYIANVLKESDLARESQIAILSRLIEELKSKNQDVAKGGKTC